ncbi:acyl-CoA dehydrogenase family protein [Halobellus sp. GM3]|uniref:acyl-CoA dehydrogenase family protein n=1 Tax=Halobellus sp. GM3 TaxID=3458410 RepID=UPI00403E2A84
MCVLEYLPMDFTLSDRQNEIQAEGRKIASGYSEEYWQDVYHNSKYPQEVYDDIAEDGWVGMLFPEEYGGKGEGVFELALFVEAMAREGAWLTGIMGGAVFGGLSILKGGTEEQRQKYLPKIAQEGQRWALGITEPEAGINTTNIQTSARRDGNSFVINGEKKFIGAAESGEHMLLLARTTPQSEVERRINGITMFIVDPDNSAISTEELDVDIYWPHDIFRVYIDDLQVPESSVLGEIDHGLRHVFDTLNVERIGTAAQSLGTGFWALDKAVEYAKHREVWSEPIGGHQAIQHPLADAYAELKTARLAIQKSAWQYDKQQGEVGELSNIANLEAAKAAWSASEAAMTTFGGSAALSETSMAAASSFIRHSRTVPITEQMIWNYLGHHILGLPQSY